MNALSVASLILSALAALLATGCFFACRTATRRHGIASLRAELDEIHDAFTKQSALLKRINARTVMQERRAAAGGPPDSDDDAAARPGESAAAWKARMRAKLVVPGKAAPHR